MSRSGYVDGYIEDPWEYIRWRGAVNAAIKGKRGQAFLRELAAALDAMPEKRLIKHVLEVSGQFCALGVIGHARGLDMTEIDPDEPDEVSDAFGIANAMAREIVFENDEVGIYDTAEERWQRMRQWVESHIIKAPNESPSQTA